MDQKTLSRIEEFQKSGQFYDALQFYRTKLTRSFRIKNSTQIAVPLVKHAFDYFLREKQYQCAIDIITLLSESLLKNNVPVDDQLFGIISKAASQLARTALNAEDEKEEELLISSRKRFVDIALQWTKNLAQNSDEKSFGSSRLHYFLANQYLAENLIELARNHFLLSDRPKEFANFLYSAWKHHAPHSEFDLIIVQAVLQLLCIDRFPNARSLFFAYVHQSSRPQSPYDHPLLNFADILLQIIPEVDVSKYSVIVDLYMSEIMRDPTFKGYLSKIGKLYFGLQDNRNSHAGGGMLSGLLGNLLGGNEAQEQPAKSHLSSNKSPSVPKSNVSSPIPKIANPAPNTMDVDDLD